MFRKPKKIQRRVFCGDDDEDGDPEPPPPPIISQEIKVKSAKKPALLSFADEEEECEEFKVKKSSQSKRLAKRREKEKKKAPDVDSNKYESNHLEVNDNHTDTENNKDNNKTKKKVTLEGLILTGRAALAAEGRGDLSDEGTDEEGEPDGEDDRGFHRYRAESVRAALAVAPGHIPDAALIHAARKTRQQARELGDFVPITSEPGPGSRLVREGEGEDSADDEDGRIIVRGLDLPSDKPKRGTAAIQSDEEINSEAEEWEEQQIKKAMPAIIDITGEAEMNPFAVAPAPPRLSDAPHLRPLAAADQPQDLQQLIHALSHRLEEVEMERNNCQAHVTAALARLEAAARRRSRCAGRRARLAASYRRAQAARGYLTDLVECLDEKMPQLEALETRALNLARKKCQFLVERRRADVRDQAQDVLALAARAGAAKPVESEEKVRRTAEREGRRRARRLQRAARGAPAPGAPPAPPAAHRDGDSSDDDLPPAQRQALHQDRESIQRESSSLFGDALEAWRGPRGVCGAVGAWRRRDPAAYCDAQLPAALPQLLAPYVRHQLILWNPLADEDNEDYEKMDWYKTLMLYGTHETSEEDSGSESEAEAEGGVSELGVRRDPDLLLVPTIVSKVVIPKVTELVEASWDPVCVRSCVRLRALLARWAASPRARAPLRRLARAAHARLAHAINADVFLPTLPPPLLEGPGGAFWRRCLGSGIRLLRASLALTAPPDVLAADALVLKLIETLCFGAGCAGGAWGALCAGWLAQSVPRAGPLRRRALRPLAALAARARSDLHSDNPLHLKSLEQVRAIIAEAKSYE